MAVQNTFVAQPSFRTPYGGIALPVGCKVAAYVCSAGAANYAHAPEIAANLVTTLDAGLARCRSGMGDAVIVLPGHAENIPSTTSIASLVTGTRIIGASAPGAPMPELRWTATGSQLAISVANVHIEGLRLRMEGANGVVKAMLITGADFTLTGCDIEVASGATAKATIAIEVGSAAHRCNIFNNGFRGTSTHNLTDCIKIVGATAPNDVRITDNKFAASVTAGNGLIHVTVASIGLMILSNFIENTHTASVTGITIDAVAADGIVADNYIGVRNTGAHTTAVTGIAAGAGCLAAFFQNFSANDPLKSGLLMPGVDT